MAYETTYGLISSLINPVWEAALWYAQHNFLMQSLVLPFNDIRGMALRKSTLYSESAVTDNLGETTDLTPVVFPRAAGVTLTPKEIGKQFHLTDRRIESDPEAAIADAARDLGYSIGKKVEQDLLGNFGSFTGAVFGNQTVAMTLDMLYAARARLESQAIPGPYYVVLHPYQYLDIFKLLTALASPAPLSVREQAQQSYYITQLADFRVYVSSLITPTVVADEVQTLTITGTPTGGTFKLSFGEQETAAIAYDATGAETAAALNLLANIGTAGCSGTGAAGGPLVITFDGTILTGVNVPLLVLSDNSLTGGSSPTITPVETTAGSNYAVGAMFTRDAMAFDLRRGLRIEPDRDASLRASELNATMIHAHGVWRADRGVVLKSDASAPYTP